MTAAKPAEREALLVAEVERLKKELAILQRQWDRKHLLGLFGLFAIPAYFVGPAYAVIVVLCTPALIGTQAYLLGVRISECKELLVEARTELARLRPPAEAAKKAG
jgi:hypothetical protein